MEVNPRILTRREGMERLQEYIEVSKSDPETAHMCADEVLLELLNDDDITSLYRDIKRYHG